jgi:hypothetical protein
MTLQDKDPIITLGLSNPKTKEAQVGSVPRRITEWTLEPELSGPIPRSVMLKRGDYWIFYLPFLFFLVVGLIGPHIFLVRSFSSRPIDSSDDWPALIPFLTVILPIGFATVFFAEWERRLSKALVERGTATRGTIVRQSWIRLRRGGYYKDVIAFETPALRHIKSKSSSARWLPVTVLYLPKFPLCARLYQDCLYKAVAPERVITT